MSDLPFRSQAAASAGSGSSGDNSYIGPGGENAAINGHQGDAPGGPLPQDDLPVIAYHGGGNGFTEGFSPSSETAPLPSSHTEGVGAPPSGNRR